MNVTFPKNFPYKATFLSALEAVCDNAGKAFTSVQESFVSFGGGLRILTVLVKVFKKFYSSQMIGTFVFFIVLSFVLFVHITV